MPLNKSLWKLIDLRPSPWSKPHKNSNREQIWCFLVFLSKYRNIERDAFRVSLLCCFEINEDSFKYESCTYYIWGICESKNWGIFLPIFYQFVLLGKVSAFPCPAKCFCLRPKQSRTFNLGLALWRWTSTPESCLLQCKLQHWSFFRRVLKGGK